MFEVPESESFDNFISTHLPLVMPIHTNRLSYQYSGIDIDVDHTTYGKNYPGVELHMIDFETMVQTESEIQNTEDKINTLAQKLDLQEITAGIGKLSNLLVHIDPEFEKKIPKK